MWNDQGARRLIYRLDDLVEALETGDCSKLEAVMAEASEQVGGQAEILARRAPDIVGGAQWRIDRFAQEIRDLRQQVACRLAHCAS
jgi:hypothetical protein